MGAYEDQCAPANPRMPMLADMKTIMEAAYYGTSFAEVRAVRTALAGTADGAAADGPAPDGAPLRTAPHPTRPSRSRRRPPGAPAAARGNRRAAGSGYGPGQGGS